VEQQQVQVTMPTVQVTVRQQGGQELQELFRTPVNSSFAREQLQQLYGPGALRLEGSNAVLAATEELQPAEAYVYQVSAAAAGGAGPSIAMLADRLGLLESAVQRLQEALNSPPRGNPRQQRSKCSHKRLSTVKEGEDSIIDQDQEHIGLSSRIPHGDRT